MGKNLTIWLFSCLKIQQNQQSHLTLQDTRDRKTFSKEKWKRLRQRITHSSQSLSNAWIYLDELQRSPHDPGFSRTYFGNETSEKQQTVSVLLPCLFPQIEPRLWSNSQRGGGWREVEGLTWTFITSAWASPFFGPKGKNLGLKSQFVVFVNILFKVSQEKLKNSIAVFWGAFVFFWTEQQFWFVLSPVTASARFASYCNG